ncbi:FOG: GGDEF domain [Moorella thermoacetica Y72]|uniref:FOG: GGDEF domain n=1 Tax=Moorella thermoacetica Y72 TaxID=1325331 RepID=A0A0S6U947_NEOTH|nr:GGDEF domain-containing protein [Moorella thermoacetica]GAF24701.1 FOG: GGDEF domain [Moorella thermoacetica Y72]
MRKLSFGPWQSLSPLSFFGGEGFQPLRISWPPLEEKHVDFLTGLPNRRGVEAVLEAAVREACRQCAAFGVILFDIDHFKKVNDTYGHHTGDAVLKIFASRLRSSIKSIDFAARYGGEEFAALVLAAEKEKVWEIGERVRLAVAGAPFFVEGKELAVTCSFGCAVFPLDGPTAEEAVKAADVALYRAKEAGRNCGILYKS